MSRAPARPGAAAQTALRSVDNGASGAPMVADRDDPRDLARTGGGQGERDRTTHGVAHDGVRRHAEGVHEAGRLRRPDPQASRRPGRERRAAEASLVGGHHAVRPSEGRSGRRPGPGARGAGP